MPRSRKSPSFPRSPRFALFAWLVWIAFAVVASVVPFFVEVRVWTPSGNAFWGCKHGSVYRASVPRSTVNAFVGEDLWLVEWNPGTSANLSFDWGPTRDIEPRPMPRSRPFVRRAPPWAVLLIPTLLVILFERHVSTWLHRLRQWRSTERRALLKAGRVPCSKSTTTRPAWSDAPSAARSRARCAQAA